MIHIKACFNKLIIKYQLIFILLFSTLIICNIFIKSVDINLETEKNKPQYRTLLIKDNNLEKIQSILNNNISIIENYFYDESTNEFTITFNNISTLENFIDKYEFEIITIEPFQDSNYMIIRNIFNGILIIINILIFILIIILGINFIHNLEKDISLYKLIGYSEKKIIYYLSVALYIFYLVTYLISIILSLTTLKILPIFNIEFIDNIKIINILNLKDYLTIGLKIIFIVTLSSINIILKIKKVTPIKLINSI